MCDATGLISYQKHRNAMCVCDSRVLSSDGTRITIYGINKFYYRYFRVASALAKSTFYCFENNSCHRIDYKCNKNERHVVEMMIFSTFRQMHTTISVFRLLSHSFDSVDVKKRMLNDLESMKCTILSVFEGGGEQGV